jgi:hypothetical protein
MYYTQPITECRVPFKSKETLVLAIILIDVSIHSHHSDSRKVPGRCRGPTHILVRLHLISHDR